MTWLQPPAHVHAMVTESWQPNAVNFTLTGGCEGLNVSAGDVAVVASEDGAVVTVRVVNDRNASISITVAVSSAMDRGLDQTADSPAQVHYSLLEGSDCAATKQWPYESENAAPCANTPAQPGLFAPTPWRAVAAAEDGEGGGAVAVPGYSYAVFRLAK